MRFSLDFNDAAYIIRSYRVGAIRVNEQELQHSVIITREVIHQWGVQDFSALQTSHFEHIRSLNPEIVILGTGATQQFPNPQLTRPLLEAGIGIEVMDTAAACRTYNIVMAEGRPVAAALLMI